MCLFFMYTGLIVGSFPFQFSNVLNLKESLTQLLSETRLHGQQDKPEGSKNVKNENEPENKQTEENLTNPGHTGFL